MREVVVAEDITFALTGRGYQLLLDMVGVDSTIIDLEWGYTLVAIDNVDEDAEKIDSLCECTELVVEYDNEEKVHTLCKTSEGCNRESPYLIRLVKDYEGKEPVSLYGLKIIEIPKDVDYVIMSTDIGGEYIAEKHRVWF